METNQIKVEMMVEGGKGEDYDFGMVCEIAGNKALVAWNCGQSTWAPIEDLTEIA